MFNENDYMNWNEGFDNVDEKEALQEDFEITHFDNVEEGILATA